MPCLYTHYTILAHLVRNFAGQVHEYKPENNFFDKTVEPIIAGSKFLPPAIIALNSTRAGNSCFNFRI